MDEPQSMILHERRRPTKMLVMGSAHGKRPEEADLQTDVDSWLSGAARGGEACLWGRGGLWGPECSGTRQRGWLCNKVNVPNAPELSLHRGEPTICSLCVPNDVTKVCLQNVRFARANVGRCPPDVRGSEEGNVCGGTTFSRAGQQRVQPCHPPLLQRNFCGFFFSFGDNIHMRKHPQASRFKVKTSLNSNWGWKPSP